MSYLIDYKILCHLLNYLCPSCPQSSESQMGLADSMWYMSMMTVGGGELPWQSVYHTSIAPVQMACGQTPLADSPSRLP